MHEIAQLANRNEYVKATNGDGVAVLEATASWCSQCKAIQPFVEKLVQKYPDAHFYQYDVDTAEDIAQELGARQMPTFSIFVDGEIQDGVTGAKAEALEKVIQQHYKGNIVDE